MFTRSKPAWILIANTTRARVLQREAGSPMVVLESFVHPAGRGVRTDAPPDGRLKESAGFAHELARYLEHEARRCHYSTLTIFASESFAQELRAALGKITSRQLAAIHEMDLTSVGVAELESRVSHELPLGAH